jgi:hypothetical protein
MPEEKFDDMLFKLTVSSTFSLLVLQVAREMFGKGYFQLGQGEKIAVDQAAFGLVLANYQVLTEENVRKQFGQQPAQNPVGFAPASPAPSKQ